VRFGTNQPTPDSLFFFLCLFLLRSVLSDVVLCEDELRIAKRARRAARRVRSACGSKKKGKKRHFKWFKIAKKRSVQDGRAKFCSVVEQKNARWPSKHVQRSRAGIYKAAGQTYARWSSKSQKNVRWPKKKCKMVGEQKM
jgi:hypothetical protein